MLEAFSECFPCIPVIAVKKLFQDNLLSVAVPIQKKPSPKTFQDRPGI
jgi:hypothetical protein